MQSQKHQKLEDNDFNELSHNILGNCPHIFHGAHNGIPQWCFCEQARKWLEEI
jgi:hypothetical protein